MSEEQKPNIVGEIVDGLHNLEQKVENFIHDAHAGEVSGAPINSAGYPSIGDGGGSLVDAAPSSSEPVQEAGGATLGESHAGSLSEDAGLTHIPVTGDAISATSANPTSTNSASQVEGSTEISDTTIATELPNAAASDAASTSIIESASSVLPASLAGAAAVVGVYASEQIKTRIANIKQQLDVHHFEQSVVAGIHAELAAIEGLL